MALEDARRWDQRYLTEKYDSFLRPRRFLEEHADLLPRSGLALDVAMGLGGNAGYLMDLGLHVIGVDISSVAVREAAKRSPGLMAVVADLSEFYIPPNRFDVIINFYYLQRDLWKVYTDALRPGGILVYETLTQEIRLIHPDIDPEYLLAPGELLNAFPMLTTLVYEESWKESDTEHPRPVAALIAQRPR